MPRILLCLVAFFVVLLGCKTMTVDDVGRLRKGMTVEEAKTALPIPPTHEYSVDIPQADVFVCVYVLSSGNYSSSYLVAFHDNKLFFWGYPQEFARSSDSFTNKVGEESVAIEARLKKKDDEKPLKY